MQKRLSIDGMSCGRCAAHVTAALSRVPGVTAARGDLAGRSAVVQGTTLDDRALAAAVSEAGYEVVEVHK